MTDMDRCPTCGHMHPNGIGIGMCGCGDCSLWWTDIPHEYLAETARQRLVELRKLAGAQIVRWAL